MSRRGTARATCLCGAVVVEVDLPATKAGHCHCHYCRRATGAAFWSWATFAATSCRVVAGADAMRDHVHPDAESTRSFCGTCGSLVLYRSPRWPDVVDVSIACFDADVDLGVPFTRRVYADRAPAWAPVPDDGVPRFGGASGVEALG